MIIKCTLGFHTWDGCTCAACGKVRDEQHNWSKDCEKCSKCGKARENQHDWSKDCEKCSICGMTRADHHDWSKDCEKCSKCGKSRENKHHWSKDCEKCSKCGKIRENPHDWSKDCEKCSKCGKTRENQHISNGSSCSLCGQERIYSYDYVLNEVKKSCDEKDDKKRSNICVQIAKLQGNCLTCLIKIVQDKKLDMYYRRWALKIASGYKGEQLSEFIKLYCLAGKLKSELLRAYYNLGDEESNVNLALFVTGEEILNTKDFFERFMAT